MQFFIYKKISKKFYVNIVQFYSFLIQVEIKKITETVF